MWDILDFYVHYSRQVFYYASQLMISSLLVHHFSIAKNSPEVL